MYKINNSDELTQEYITTVYSSDAKNKLKLVFGETEIENPDNICEKVTCKTRIIPNGSKSFSLDNLVSKEAQIILHDIDLSLISNPVQISIGTYLNSLNDYAYVPLGIFLIQDTPTTDKNKTTIKLRDYSTKLDFNYDASEIIDANDGIVTKLQILEDICDKAGITTLVESFDGDTDEIGIYDNTKTARTYVSYIAEQAGAIATIDRNGNLIFVYINDLEVHNIPLSIVEKYEVGDTYKIGRVVFDDGINPLKYPNQEVEGKDNLFLNASNPYITNQDQINNIYTIANGFEINSFKTGKILGCPILDGYDLIQITDDENTYKTLATYDFTYNGVMINTYDTTITEEAKKENSSITGEENIYKRIHTEIDNTNAELKVVAEQVEGTDRRVTELNISLDGITERVENNEVGISELNLRADGLDLKVQKTGNNLLYGTSLYDFSQWGLQPLTPFVEADNPPALDIPEDFWYCTKDSANYTNGIVYAKGDTTWEETAFTRKNLEEGFATNYYIDILETEWTKNNFLSQRAFNLKAERDENVANAYTTFKPTLIDKNQDEFTMSFKIQNNLERGILDIAILENVNTVLTEDNANQNIQAISNVINVGEHTNLDRFERTIPIFTSNRIVTGYMGSEEPTDTSIKYWLSETEEETNIYILQERQEDNTWTMVKDKIFTYNNAYYLPNLITLYGVEIAFYLERDLPSYDTKLIYGIINIQDILIGLDGNVIESSTEPEPFKGAYWVDETNDRIYYARYSGEEFDEWQLLDYTYSDAVENATEFEGESYPTITAKGNVIMGDIHFEYGNVATDWCLNENESYGKNYRLDDKGFAITKGDYEMFIDEDEVTGYYQGEKAFQLNQYNTYSMNGIFESTDQNGLVTKKLSNGIYVRYIK